MSERNTNGQPEAPLKKLASAEDLRGRKSGTDKSGKPAKKRKLWLSLIGLCVLLAAAIGVYFITQSMQPAADDTQQTASDYVSETVKLIENKRSNVASVTLQGADGASYTVLNNYEYDENGSKIEPKDGSKGYAIEGLETFDLDQTKADTIIGYGANLTASEMVTDSASDLAEFGLAQPRATVTMNYKDGTSSTWLVGDKAPTSTGSYFMEKGKKAVFLLYASAINSMLQTRNSLHVVQMPYTIDSTTVYDMIIEAEGKDTIELRMCEEDDQFSKYSISSMRIVQPIYYAAHTDRTSEFFTGASELTISAYAGELSELENTGLEDGGARIRVTTETHVTTDAGTEVKTYVYRIGNFASADQVYVQIDDTDAVYLTDSSNVAFLDNAKPGYLVDLFSNLVNITKVDHIDVTLGDEKWEMDVEHITKEGETRTTEVFSFNGKAADDKLFRKLYQELIGLMNSKINDDYDYTAEPYMTVTYTLNVEPYELVIEFMEYDQDYLVVRRDNLSLFMIKRDKIDALAAALRAFDEGTYEPVG